MSGYLPSRAIISTKLTTTADTQYTITYLLVLMRISGKFSATIICFKGGSNGIFYPRILARDG